MKQCPELFANPPDASYEILADTEFMDDAESEEKRRLSDRGLPISWSVTGVVYEDHFTIILRDAVRRPDGSLGTYVRVLPANGFRGAAVLPIHEGSIVLVRRFRHATRQWHLQIPCCHIEADIEATAQVTQELREELDAEPSSNLIHLGSLHLNTSTAVDKVELYFAEISAFRGGAEGISGIECCAPNQVAQLIRNSQITDALTVGAFTQAWLRGLLPDLLEPYALDSFPEP